jgi:NAD(P)-dependent dehydrogenase (short-subunit alcohol dehydrogenase family)
MSTTWRILVRLGETTMSEGSVPLMGGTARHRRGSLDGRVAVVTGGARGIGRAICARFAAAGARVAVAARSVEHAQTVVDEIHQSGGAAFACYCDVTDEASLASVAARVHADAGQVDIVVANAGIAGPTTPMQDISLTEWRDCIDVNVTGVFLTFRAFIPSMVGQGRGSLIALSSITGKRPLAQRTPYATSKMAVIGLVRTLAAELGPDGIRVNSVCPGAVVGERIEQVLLKQAEATGIDIDEVRRRFTEPAALRRFVQAEEVADACVFLASDAGSAITGEDLNVSAGLVMF